MTVTPPTIVAKVKAAKKAVATGAGFAAAVAASVAATDATSVESLALSAIGIVTTIVTYWSENVEA